MIDYEILNNEETKILHKIQLDILKEFIYICDNLKLKYYVIGGTALGTIRHEGFIPWDDDIDIGMPRNDYELFLKKAPLIISKKYFIQTHISDPLYPHNFAKIRDENTTFIEKSVKHLDISHGVYIDIFPLDGVRTSKWIKYKFNIKNKVYSKKISEMFDLSIYGKKLTIKGRLFKVITNILLSRYSYQEVIIKKENLLKKYKYEDNEIVANFCGAWGEKEIVPKSYFGDGTNKLFENISVIVPEKYDEYLTRLYGDYMKLPPIEQRVTHHYCSIIDLNKSYKHYINKNQ